MIENVYYRISGRPYRIDLDLEGYSDIVVRDDQGRRMYIDPGLRRIIESKWSGILSEARKQQPEEFAREMRGLHG